MTTGSWIAVTGYAVLVAGSALAEAPAAAVIDGDTVRYNGTVLHLWGIDAPESGQTCSDGWQAGKMAADYLAGLVHNRSLACDLRQSPSTPGRTYALCRADGQDLSSAMAEAGMAWSYTPQTKDYTVQETNAMIGVFGVHAHDCMKAWEWRNRQLPPR
ncbi:thermonuclease family protein [Reyranella sp.]|uniref:thermonuclease family protein n=1 Tax=Reyranella sp. TaxID=1929291 RepID=UPI003D1534C4